MEREHKCRHNTKAWEPPLIWSVWKILRTFTVIVDWKVTLSKLFCLFFQNHELWYFFSLCFQPRVFNLAIKSHGSRVSPSLFKAPTIESIIVILCRILFIELNCLRT